MVSNQRHGYPLSILTQAHFIMKIVYNSNEKKVCVPIFRIQKTSHANASILPGLQFKHEGGALTFEQSELAAAEQ